MLSNKDVLKDRFDATVKTLEARLAQLKADARDGARRETSRITNQLSELRDSIAAGWETLTEEAASRLNGLLAREDKSQAASNASTENHDR